MGLWIRGQGLVAGCLGEDSRAFSVEPVRATQEFVMGHRILTVSLRGGLTVGGGGTSLPLLLALTSVEGIEFPSIASVGANSSSLPESESEPSLSSAEDIIQKYQTARDLYAIYNSCLCEVWNVGGCARILVSFALKERQKEYFSANMSNNKSALSEGNG